MARGRRASLTAAWLRGLAAAGVLFFSLHRLGGVYFSERSTGSPDSDKGIAPQIALGGVASRDREEIAYSPDGHNGSVYPIAVGGVASSDREESASSRDGDEGSVSPAALGGVAASSDREESADSQRPVSGGGGGGGGGLVLIKSFKTGSTTLATYIAQVGHQRGSYFLHPRATGWFKQGELESRRDLGHKFDISLRHVTPYTAYGVLDELVPGAAYVTIMRRPVERFLSLFNFREELKNKFKTPQALVQAIRAGRLPQSDARPFCNQLAWLMSGQDIDYTGIVDEAEASRVAGEVIKEADKRGVTVLLTERMSESFAILANRMRWDLDNLSLSAGSQRVQKLSARYYVCAGIGDGVDDECSSTIRRCNLVDEVLYEHYERRFEDLVRALPSSMSVRASALLEDLPKAKPSMSQFDLGKFPTNCINDGAQGVREPDGLGVAPSATPAELYQRLHSCDGRPHPP